MWLLQIAIDGLARVLCMDEYLDKEPVKVIERQAQPQQQFQPTLQQTVTEDSVLNQKNKHRKSSCKTLEANFGRLQQPSQGAKNAGGGGGGWGWYGRGPRGGQIPGAQQPPRPRERHQGDQAPAEELHRTA